MSGQRTRMYACTAEVSYFCGWGVTGTDSIGNVTDDTGTGTGTGKQPKERYACADSRVRESKQKSVTYVNRVNYLT